MDNKAPKLPGIVPLGSHEEPTIEPIHPWVKLIAQFFLIPMAIVVFCVGLIFVFRWMTWEKRETTSYLSALSSASRSSFQKEQDAFKLLNYIQESKRWQGIYDVTEQLRLNREKFLADNPDFPMKVAQIFRQSTGADRGMRQYLVQVLGLVGGPDVLPVLISALNDSDSETVIHSMVALGRIGDTSAIPALLEISKSDDRGLRQTAIFVLGNFKDPIAINRCAEALNDSDLLVSWNAAFALARNKDARAIPTLKYFLDVDYVQRMTRDYESLSSESPGVIVEKKIHSAEANPPSFATANYGEVRPSPISPQQASEYSAKANKSPQSDKDRNHLSTFHPERLEQYRATAVRLLGQFADEKIRNELQMVAAHDQQLKVRQAAIESLSRHP